MSTYITLLSSIIDNIVLYLYFQTMFEKRKDKVRLNKIAARWSAKAVAQFYFY